MLKSYTLFQRFCFTMLSIVFLVFSSTLPSFAVAGFQTRFSTHVHHATKKQKVVALSAKSSTAKRNQRRRMDISQETSAPNLTFSLEGGEEDSSNYQFGLGSGGRNRSAALRRERQLQNISPSSRVYSIASEQQEHMRMLDSKPALVLNADYQPVRLLPLSLWHWQEVVRACFSGKVTAVAVYPDITIRAANKEIALPSVIALKEYVPLPNTVPRFTKHNVFLRDEHRCQYCGNRFQARDLTLDHVTPRCMGGQLEWDNVVTSCQHCNAKKGFLRVNQLHQIGMSLIREPFTPTQYQLYHSAGQLLPRKVHPTWIPYLEHYDASASLSSPTHESASTFQSVRWINREGMKLP